MYTIKVNKTNRYIKYCDECWYETTSEPFYSFTEDRANKIAEQMRHHYVYEMTIIGEDGSSKYINHLMPKTNPMIKVEIPKKSIFKISSKRMYE